MSIFDPIPPDLPQSVMPRRVRRTHRVHRKRCMASRCAGIGALATITIMAAILSLTTFDSQAETQPSSIERCMADGTTDTPAPETTLEAPTRIAAVNAVIGTVQPRPMTPFIADQGSVEPIQGLALLLTTGLPDEPAPPRDVRRNVAIRSVEAVVTALIDQGFGWSIDAMTHHASAGCAYQLFLRAFHLPWEFW